MSEPLTPPDCDLRDFQFMPLDVRRLRDSDLAALETPEACWTAVQLWGAAWHQVPAGSLPNDDRVLAQLAGFGRVLKEWLRVKEGALRGFVLCTDGRLYHPVVAEKAIEAWRGKLEQRWRTECARIKKKNQRTGANEPLPSLEDFLAGRAGVVPEDAPDLSPGTQDDVPRDNDPMSLPRPPGNGIQGTGIGTGTGIKEKEADASSLGGAGPRARTGKTPIPDGFPDADAIKAAEAWIAEAAVALDASAHASRFRQHALANGRLLVDWLAAWKGWIGIECEKAPTAAKTVGPAVNWAGPSNIRAAVAEAMGEDRTRGYLDRCRWRSAPTPAVISDNSYVIDILRREAGEVLANLSVDIVLERERAA